MCPDTTKRRDLICILYGRSVPVILRLQKDEKTGEENSQFVGECYVHGIMYGEAFELVRSRSPKGEIDKQGLRDSVSMHRPTNCHAGHN